MRSFVVASLIGLAALGACAKRTDEAVAARVPAITVAELDAQLAAGAAQAVDANGESTRKRMGVIPGAVLLTDSGSFQLAELPADKSKPLVFYCANTYCGASHEAADKAVAAGYRHVAVLPDGIAGWVKAGKRIDSI
jgi:rhodanese-related sulfurtransferase